MKQDKFVLTTKDQKIKELILDEIFSFGRHQFFFGAFLIDKTIVADYIEKNRNYKFN